MLSIQERETIRLTALQQQQAEQTVRRQDALRCEYIDKPKETADDTCVMPSSRNHATPFVMWQRPAKATDNIGCERT